MKKRMIRLTVNGDEYDLIVAPNRTLLEVLRDDLSLTGAKVGCDEGACGMCTVLLDGQPVRSCLTLAVEVQGKPITTIEGLASPSMGEAELGLSQKRGAGLTPPPMGGAGGGEQLHPIQQAFVEHGAIQCGFCSPGMILVTKALLDENPHPTEQEAREAISGNFCRCTGYAKIVEAMLAAAEAVAGGQHA